MTIVCKAYTSGNFLSYPFRTAAAEYNLLAVMRHHWIACSIIHLWHGTACSTPGLPGRMRMLCDAVCRSSHMTCQVCLLSYFLWQETKGRVQGECTSDYTSDSRPHPQLFSGSPVGSSSCCSAVGDCYTRPHAWHANGLHQHVACIHGPRVRPTSACAIHECAHNATVGKRGSSSPTQPRRCSLHIRVCARSRCSGLPQLRKTYELDCVR